ncbi:DegV family protein [Prauserella alba]|uniref:DegV family protein n=2 Tax=Prauserella alba TaxID=176898 RepID=UPI0020A2B1D2|nr:DegV family protein [Prauserella alba]
MGANFGRPRGNVSRVPVAVITDSTASLPERTAKQWDISVVPVQVVVGDRVDDENRYDRDELLRRLRNHEPVSTQPPDPGAFFWTFQDAVSAGATAIVCLHISTKLSATADAAREAAQQVGVPVYVLDSGTTNMSLGFAAVSAARAAAAGAPVERVMSAADARIRSSTELIYVDTLDYLRRGGRIGGAAAVIGSALSIRPILTLSGGEVAPLARVPGTKRAIAKLVDLAVQHAGDATVDVAVSSAEVGDREQRVAGELRRRLASLGDLTLVQGSTVIGAHVGPRALGITVSPAR